MPTKTMHDLGIDGDAVEDALSRSLTFPARWYSDPEIYAFENERIFTRSWQYAGPLEKLQKPGDHVVCRVGQVPIVVTRDSAGELHGFINVCRHRAYPVAACDGNCGTLRCQYHGWTYNLDGRLRKAPRSEREREFDQSDFSLLPVSIDTSNAFVFVNPDPQAPSLRESYPEFEPLARERGLHFTGYRYHGRLTCEIRPTGKCGWRTPASATTVPPSTPTASATHSSTTPMSTSTSMGLECSGSSRDTTHGPSATRTRPRGRPPVPLRVPLADHDACPG